MRNAVKSPHGKSRHCRDESDPLLAFYSYNIAATSSDPISKSFRTNSNLDEVRSSTRMSLRAVHPEILTSASNGSAGYDSSDGNGEIIPLKGAATTPTSYNSDNNSVHSRASFVVKKPEKKKKGYRVHRVSYTAHNHIQVLFRMYGSAFPQVLPFCVVNLAWTLVVIMFKEHNIADLTFHSSVGHSFMGLLVSFLIVNRSKISYDRFMEVRRHLATTYRTCREIAQFTTVYSFEKQTEEAKKWRQEVCYRTILLLRVTMDALLWSSTERDHWEDEYYTYKTGTTYDEFGELGEDDNVSEHFFRFRALTHGRRSMIDENTRAPISYAHVLRQTIMEHPHAKYLGYKLAVNEYRDLLNFVTIFIEAFHGFRVLIFTPYPFSLVQMTRTFLLFWVYTLPLVLLKDYRIWSSLIIVVIVTFGFIGIEYVSIALDDPFGDETNDVDEHGMALLVYEDIYMAIYRTDGPAAALELRERVLARYKKGRGLDCYRSDLKGVDFWEPYTQTDESKWVEEKEKWDEENGFRAIIE